jgi:hypothetical protein
MLKFWVAVVGFSGILCFLTAAQEAGPTKVTVEQGQPQCFAPGCSLTYVIHFDRAPQHYDGGNVGASFESVTDTSSSELYNYVEPLLGKTGASVPLVNGQRDYTLTLRIGEWMIPGKWRMVEVGLGQTAGKTFPVPESVSFEIPSLRPFRVHFQAPKNVVAGQRFVFTATLDEYPNDLYKDCAIRLSVQLKSDALGRWGIADPGCVILKPGQLSYEIPYSFKSDYPGSVWQVELHHGAGPVNPDVHFGCRYPRMEGDTHATFILEPNKELVTPTSVEVTVNPSQVKLLLVEADHLKAKAQDLRQRLSSADTATKQVLLQTSVQEAKNDLDRTEKIYKEQGGEPSSELAKDINIFFQDIRTDYADALKEPVKQSAQNIRGEAQFELVRASLREPNPPLDPVSEAVVGSVLHNAAAYEVVASTRDIRFNLDVYSDPQGATISWKLRGDQYKPVDHDTDWRIENLPIAVYYIRLQKNGYADKETRFDAISNSGSSIHVHLERKQGAQ